MPLSNHEELERLKRQQAELLIRLSSLGRELQDFERRLGEESPSEAAAAADGPAAGPRAEAFKPGAPPVFQPFSAPPPLAPFATESARRGLTAPLPAARPQALMAAGAGEVAVESRNHPTPAGRPSSVPPPLPPKPTGTAGAAVRPPVAPATRAVEEAAAWSAGPGLAGAGAGVPPEMPAARESASFEMRLGQYWLVRIGVVMLLTGLAFFGAYAYENFIPRLGPAGKTGLLYVASVGLLGLGAWLERRQEALRNYAQVLLAGGLAAVYFTTYAAWHVPALRVISSAVIDGAALFAWAGVMVWLADRRKSETMALFAVLLAAYSSAITHLGLFTLYSNLVLALAGVFFLVRNRWSSVSYAALAATYGGYAFWRFYQDGQTPWASPAHGLWTAGCFLLAYWTIFTVALFLSRDATLKGRRRATLLTLNNGAFFGTFLLTMFQTQAGGFWKFSLCYGVVLLALTGLASRLRREDRFFWNACLTQSLLLLTLGLVTRFVGFDLSLLLTFESLTLVLLGRRLENRVMRAGSYAAALLATGWDLASLEAWNVHDLRCAMAVGAGLLGAAFSVRDEASWKKTDCGPRVLGFTTLALVVWLQATWQNTPALWRGFVLAAESMVFMLAARPLRNSVLERSALLFGALGAVATLAALGAEYSAVAWAGRTGLGPAAGAGALLLGGAVLQRGRGASARGRWAPRVSACCAMGLGVWLAATLVFAPLRWQAPLLGLEALLLTAASHPLRLPEVAFFGQGFLLAAHLRWLSAAAENGAPPPWWNPVGVIAATLTLSHWWQRQRSLKLPEVASETAVGAYSLGVVALLYQWLHPQLAGPAWPGATALLAVALALYGACTGSWLLAAAGQCFAAICAFEFLHEFALARPGWPFPLVPAAALLLLAQGAASLPSRRTLPCAELERLLLSTAALYRGAAALMSLWWIEQYLWPAWRCVVLAALGALLFLLSGWRSGRPALLFSGLFTAAALARFAWPPAEGPAVTWFQIGGLLLPPLEQRLARRWPVSFPIPPQIQAAAIVGGSLSVWLYLTRLVHLHEQAFYLTAAWAALAFLFFLAGMLWRERMYRWLGLGVLACASGRVVLFDIWNLARIYQILSFMALGVVLLALGFLYNRYQAKLKEWL